MSALIKHLFLVSKARSEPVYPQFKSIEINKPDSGSFLKRVLWVMLFLELAFIKDNLLLI